MRPFGEKTPRWYPVPLPDPVFSLMTIFQKVVRPLLNPKADVINLWINRNGKALRSYSLSQDLKKVLAILTPGKHLTSLDFRRMCSSKIFANELEWNLPKGMTFEAFTRHVARLQNHDPRIMEGIYSKSKQIDLNTTIIELVEQQTLTSPKAEVVKSQLARIRAEMEGEEEEEVEEDNNEKSFVCQQVLKYSPKASFTTDGRLVIDMKGKLVIRVVPLLMFLQLHMKYFKS